MYNLFGIGVHAPHFGHPSLAAPTGLLAVDVLNSQHKERNKCVVLTVAAMPIKPISALKHSMDRGIFMPAGAYTVGLESIT